MGGPFDDLMDTFISNTRKNETKEMKAAGNKITFRGHVIEPDDPTSDVYLSYHVDGERPNGYSSIRHAKERINKLEDDKTAEALIGTSTGRLDSSLPNRSAPTELDNDQNPRT